MRSINLDIEENQEIFDRAAQAISDWVDSEIVRQYIERDKQDQIDKYREIITGHA